MATPASILITTALQRVRDPQGSMHARTDVLTLLGHVQRLVNGLTRHRVVTATLTLTPRQYVYPIASILPTAQSVLVVRYDGGDLEPSRWPDWWGVARGLARTVADHPLVWDTVGHDCLMVWPPPAREGVTVEVVATERLPDLGGEMTDLSLHESLHPLLLDVLELVLLVKGRDAASVPAALAALQGALARV